MNRKRVLVVLALLTLAGCGVDGDPIPPTMNVNIGISADGSVGAMGGIGLHQGPISLFFGF